MSPHDQSDFTACIASLCARFNRRATDELSDAYWPSAKANFPTVAHYRAAVQRAIDSGERFPSPDELVRLRPQKPGEGHHCSACEGAGWVHSPNVAVLAKPQGEEANVRLYDKELAPAEGRRYNLMRPCPNRTDARAERFYASQGGSR